MDLYLLVHQIKESPEKAKDILSSFHSDDSAINDFIKNLKAPTYMLPAIIHAFTIGLKGKEPECAGDLVSGNHVGSLFSLLDGTGYTYVGQAPDGLPLCRPDNSPIIEAIQKETPIKWFF